jgi:hypothetical protein
MQCGSSRFATHSRFSTSKPRMQQHPSQSAGANLQLVRLLLLRSKISLVQTHRDRSDHGFNLVSSVQNDASCIVRVYQRHHDPLTWSRPDTAKAPTLVGVEAFAADHITVEVAGIEPASNVVL